MREFSKMTAVVVAVLSLGVASVQAQPTAPRAAVVVPGVLLATQPPEVDPSINCDDQWHRMGELALSFQVQQTVKLDITSGTNATIEDWAATVIAVDGVNIDHSFDVFDFDDLIQHGRVSFNSAGLVDIDPGTHVVEVRYRCQIRADFDNSGRLVVRLLPQRSR